MKKTNLENYYDFFLELPPTDYLTDIEIQDEYETTNDTKIRGLSDEQVSQIAHDSIQDARRLKRHEPTDQSAHDTPQA